MASPFSPDPDSETFSTPPTTPAFIPVITRKNSRPTSLSINQPQATWNPDIIVESQPSPEITRKLNGNAHHPDATVDSPIDHNMATAHFDPQRGIHTAPLPYNTSLSSRQSDKPMASPCFVHSHLDKGASFADIGRHKHHMDGSLGVSPSLRLPHANGFQPHLNGHTAISGQYAPGLKAAAQPVMVDEEDDSFGGTLTEQLAETAVGVREMSKQLGRARIRSNIQSILIITKARDNRLIKLTRELALYLMLGKKTAQGRGMVVYVDNQLRHSKRFDAEGIMRDHPELMTPFPRRRSSSSNSLSSMSSSSTQKDEFYVQEEGQLRYWTSDMCSRSPHLFDFVVTLGGDGTVLFTSWLFQRIVPPVLPFALGSLGFLTNFDFADHQAVMDSAIDSGIRVNLRMRFTCTVYRAISQKDDRNRRKAVKKGETGEIIMKNIEKGGWEALEGGWSGTNMPDGAKSSKDKEIMCFTTRPVETFEVLNDLVVDRGPSPYVSLLELFGDEHHMTTVQADGLTVSTPTGSTAYSLSAGGSLVHPEIPALLITPICPHTLSFRPMLLPDTMELRICVPFNSRSTAWASFDGRGRVELKQGDHIKVTASKYPFPTVCADKQSTDWFHSISRTLKWNERERQKSFVVVEEEGPSKSKRHGKRASTVNSPQTSTPPEPVDETEELQLDDDEEDEVSDEEEEDTYDIDDSSPEAAQVKKVETATTHRMDPLAPPIPLGVERQQRSRSALRRSSKSRTRSETPGVTTPGRFAGTPPHPPAISNRHVDFGTSQFGSGSTSSSNDSLTAHFAQEGARDDIHSPKSMLTGGKSRIPKDRELDPENIKTPTLADQPLRRHHHRVESGDIQKRMAFAAWGQDESDSNASDSDA